MSVSRRHCRFYKQSVIFLFGVHKLFSLHFRPILLQVRVFVTLRMFFDFFTLKRLGDFVALMFFLSLFILYLMTFYFLVKAIRRWLELRARYRVHPHPVLQELPGDIEMNQFRQELFQVQHRAVQNEEQI